MKYCAKVYKPRFVTINNVIRTMRCALMKVAIDEKKRSDKFLSGSDKYSSCLDRSQALNQKKMGRFINAHRTTAGRLLKQMEANREITVSRKPLQEVYDLKHDMWTVDDNTRVMFGLDKRHVIVVNGVGFVRDANEYFPNERTSFNVIINAHNRVGNGTCVVNRTRQVNDVPRDHADVFYY